MPYVCGRTIGALWAINEDNNAWVWVNGLGWRKLDTTNTRNLLLVAARAKLDGTAVNLNEEVRGSDTVITQITPVPFAPSANEVSHSESECIYSWTAAYEQRGANITVRIQLNKDANVTDAELAAAQARWQPGIRNKWSGHFGCCDDPAATTGKGCPQACTLMFDVQWVTSNAHHVVAVHRGPGRADMLNWFHDDIGDDAAHEFGHMLGNHDEYPDPACPNRSPVNTGTVMAVVSGPVVQRQVDFLCTAIGDGTVTL
jgi:hypothetical protein